MDTRKRRRTHDPKARPKRKSEQIAAPPPAAAAAPAARPKRRRTTRADAAAAPVEAEAAPAATPAVPAATPRAASKRTRDSASSSRRKAKRERSSMDRERQAEAEKFARAMLASLNSEGFDHEEDDEEDEDDAFAHFHRSEEEEEDDEDGDEGGEREREREAEQRDDGSARSHAEGSARALHELLACLRGGSGAPRFGLGGMNSKYKRLLDDLQSPDPSARDAALGEVTQMLLMGNEETLGGFRVDAFVPALHELLNVENAQTALMACRALCNMLEAIPQSASSVVACAPSLCAKLLCIEYIDLAEQSLTTLEKLSQTQGAAVLKAGGANAVLTFLDFFPTSVQRSAVSTAANLCKYAHPSEYALVRDSVPILCNLLTRRDKSMLESTIMCFSNLVSNLASDDEKLHQLASPEMLKNLLDVLREQPLPVGPKCFTLSVRMLSTVAGRCPDLIPTLHEESIVSSLRAAILGSSELASDSEEPQSPEERPQAAGSGQTFAAQSDQLYELITLACRLLPSLPSSLFFTRLVPDDASADDVIWEWLSRPDQWTAYSRDDCMRIERAHTTNARNLTLFFDHTPYRIDLDNMVQVNHTTRNTRPIRRRLPGERGDAAAADEGDGAAAANDSDAAERRTDEDRARRIQYYKDHPEVLSNFCDRMLGVLFDIYLSAALPALRCKVLETILRMFSIATQEQLTELLRNVACSSYIAGMLSQPSDAIVVGALHLVQVLMEKLPSIFNIHFRRRGVVHQIGVLAARPVPDAPSSRPRSGSRGSSRRSRSGSSRRSSGGGSVRTKQDADAQKAAEIGAFIAENASKLLDKFFDGQKAADPCDDPHSALDVLRALKKASDNLVDSWSGEQSMSEEAALSAIHDMFAREGQDGIASFEMVHSKLPEAILSYLTAPNDAGATGRMERIERFCKTIMDRDDSSHMFALLVDTLHGALNTVERFPSKQPSASTNSDALNLSTPIKLKLERAPNQPIIKEYSSQTVLIEPLTAVQAIEDFLWPRVRMSKEEREAALSQAQQQRKLRSRGSNSSLPPEDSTEADLDTSHVYEQDSEEGSRPPSRSSRSRRSGADVVELRIPAADAGAAAEWTEPEPAIPPVATQHKLSIFLNDQILPSHLSIYQVLKGLTSDEEGSEARGPEALGLFGLREPRGRTYTLHYALYQEEQATSLLDSSVLSAVPSAEPDADTQLLAATARTPLEKLVLLPADASIPSSDPAYTVLSLLHALKALNDYRGLLIPEARPLLNDSAFVNNKLSNKLMRQINDFEAICRSSFPDWCRQVVSTCPFIVPFESRQLYFYYTAFGSVRALLHFKAHTQGSDETDNSDRQRLSKVKVRLERPRLFESIFHVMTGFATSPAMLEIEYFDEAGTGLGPTLEFYALGSREFRKAHRRLWYNPTVSGSSVDTGAFVHRSEGLFPAPLTAGKSHAEEAHHFRTLGMFVAKAIIDGRMLDLPLSHAFFMWMRGLEENFHSGHLKLVDEQLAASVAKLEAVVAKMQAIEADASLSDADKAAAVAELTLDGARIEDLCLDFTVPGYAGVEIKPDGANQTVTIDTLPEYIKDLTRFVLVDGVQVQMRAFRSGFNEVFPLEHMALFSLDELDRVLNGLPFHPWRIEELREACKTDHGYNAGSQAIQFLFEILSSFDREEQRLFVSFLTGCPNLPVGGFKALTPPLTIVRKTPSHGSTADQELPSVMTCQNYLKLPDCSTRDIMEHKLRQAMTEGQSSFHLS
eukprot:m.3111 g.3111  ORF g.3111 m.3111 type:complete len:1732 (-) comp2265_c0_seq1:248-5443(-)